MQNQTTYVGMDVHARTIRVAVLGAGGAQREEWGLANEPRAVASLSRRLLRGVPGPVVACYEAGPTGFALMRQLRAKGAAAARRAPPSPRGAGACVVAADAALRPGFGPAVPSRVRSSSPA